MLGDILLLLFFTVSSYILLSWHLMEPVHRPISCDDESIRQPLLPNTVSTPLLLLLTLGAPFIMVVVGNYLATFGTTLQHLESLVAVIHASTFAYLDYVISFWLLTLVLDLIKCAVGRLRPNFVAMCKADLSACNSPELRTPDGYVLDAECAADWKKMRNSRMSFPSGHAAASVFALLYTIYYFHHLHSQQKPQSSRAYLRIFHSIAVLFFSAFTAYCCATRITDYWHFPSDVFGGSLIAIAGFYLFSRRLKPSMKLH